MQPYLESEHTILEISYPISKSKKNKPAAQEKAHLQTAPPAPKPTSAKELFLPLFPLRQKRINFPPLLLHICNSLNKKALHITRVWQKWRFSATQTHLWLIKVCFSASTFVVKIATFAKPENVSIHCKTNSKHKKYVT